MTLFHPSFSFYLSTLFSISFLICHTKGIHSYAHFLTWKISLPEARPCIYWNEPDSSKPEGWYRGSITDYLPNGKAVIVYPDEAIEHINLLTVNWTLARKNAKCFIAPPEVPPPPPKAHPKVVKYAHGHEHKAKAFADDMTIITASKDDHQCALIEVDAVCRSLGLYLKPSKCVSITVHKGSVLPYATFQLSDGQTRNISDSPTTFLGKTIASNTRHTNREASRILKKDIMNKLSKVDACPIRGEIKLWILCSLIIPSIHFHLAVNTILATTISFLDNSIAKLIKKWLKLPRNATRIIFHHPSILNIPPLRDCQSKAKISLLANISTSTDPAVREIVECLLTTPSCVKNQIIPKDTVLAFQSAQLSTSTSKSSLKSIIRKKTRDDRLLTCNQKLQGLSVQGKYLDVVHLEEDTHVWHRIISGLPKKQLSFLLRAGSDTLPSPMKLRCWKLRVSAKCSLCANSTCTTAHILSGCPSALEDGRNTWRHDPVLHSIFWGIRSITSHSTHVFADLPGLRASNAPQSTIPLDVLVTSSRPDMVVINYHTRTVNMLELTVCGNTLEAIAASQSQKANKTEYQGIVSDLYRLGWIANYGTIEIGALGHYNPSAPETLQHILPWISLHKWRKFSLQPASLDRHQLFPGYLSSPEQSNVELDSPHSSKSLNNYSQFNFQFNLLLLYY